MLECTASFSVSFCPHVIQFTSHCFIPNASDLCFTSVDVFRDLSSSLVHFDISDNPNINQIDLNATIHTVASSPYITTMRLSNVNLTDLTYVLTPLVDAGKESEYIRVQLDKDWKPNKTTV